MNKHIVALPKKLCQNHCLIHHNVVRHECITCILIPQYFIYYSIFVSHCMFHFNKQLFLVALVRFFVFSQFHFVTLVFLIFFVSFTLYVLFLPKDRNYLPQHVHLIRVHTLCMTYGHWIFFLYIYANNS